VNKVSIRLSHWKYQVTAATFMTSPKMQKKS